MKQAENSKSKYLRPTWMSQNQPDISELPDSCWKKISKPNQDIPVKKPIRIPTAEKVASYYSSNSYEPRKNHAHSTPTYFKCTSPHAVETPTDQGPYSNRRGREEHCTSNLGAARKSRYTEESQENGKPKYVLEVLGDVADDNLEGYIEEEEGEQEETGEFSNYEEQEADDEIDEESDAPQTHRVQGDRRKETVPRARWTTKEHDPSSLRTQRYISYDRGRSSNGRYHDPPVLEFPDQLSEDYYIPASATFKNSSKKYSMDYRHGQQSRSSTDRYVPSPLPIQSIRRVRTKPEIERLVETGKAKRCTRCGILSNKNIFSRNRNDCRLYDHTNFPMKGPIGDESEFCKQEFCGYCDIGRDPWNVDGYEVPISSYAPKSRRLREAKSPICKITGYNSVPDKSFKRYSQTPIRYTGESSNFIPEKGNKKSVHPNHCPTIMSTRYE